LLDNLTRLQRDWTDGVELLNAYDRNAAVSFWRIPESSGLDSKTASHSL